MLPIKNCLSIIFLILFAGLALADSSIDLTLKQNRFKVAPGEHFILKFELEGLVDDDNDIDAIDLYLLDLRDNFEVIKVKGENWEHELVERYNDEHIFIREAKNQSVKVHLRAKEGVTGTFDLQGYYQFMDFDGSVMGLGDNQAIGPTHDNQNHYFARVEVKEKEASLKEYDPSKYQNAPSHIRLEAQEDGLNFLRQNPLYLALNAWLAGIIA